MMDVFSCMDTLSIKYSHQNGLHIAPRTERGNFSTMSSVPELPVMLLRVYRLSSRKFFSGPERVSMYASKTKALHREVQWRSLQRCTAKHLRLQ